MRVAPLVGAWIEIQSDFESAQRIEVAPLVGAWIEISIPFAGPFHFAPSLLSWERGLKSMRLMYFLNCSTVAPLVGAWIEIGLTLSACWAVPVAPLVGAWIEIEGKVFDKTGQFASLLSWERGLK